MKKNILTLLAAFSILALALPVLGATTASLTPTSINAVTGQNFSVTIRVNPQGSKNFAEKVELRFPADLLEVRSFTLGGTWMALSQPGYDITDNTNGVLVKTAGYPSGISSNTVFGTVSFRAKKTGTGSITIGSNSLAFEASTQGVITGPGASITITAPVVNETNNQTTNTNESNEIAETNVTQPSSSTENTNTGLAALIGAILTLGTGNMWVGILAIIIVLLAIAYTAYKMRENRQNGFLKIK